MLEPRGKRGTERREGNIEVAIGERREAGGGAGQDGERARPVAGRVMVQRDRDLRKGTEERLLVAIGKAPGVLKSLMRGEEVVLREGGAAVRNKMLDISQFSPFYCFWYLAATRL